MARGEPTQRLACVRARGVNEWIFARPRWTRVWEGKCGSDKKKSVGDCVCEMGEVKEGREGRRRRRSESELYRFALCGRAYPRALMEAQ